MEKELEARFSEMDAKLVELLAATKGLEKIMFAVVQQLKAEAQSKHHLYPDSYYSGVGTKSKTCG